MLKLLLLGLASVAAYDYTTVPGLNYDKWWGDSDKEVDDPEIYDFEIKFSDDLVKDLLCRLAHTREFIPSMDGVGFTYGIYTQSLGYWLDYWQYKYNFTEREAYLNQFPHKRTMIQGLWTHFVHIKPEVPEGKFSIPVLMLHGWLGSVREFYDAIPLITANSPDRNFVVELVVPSLIGFGYSDYTNKTGLGSAEMAFIFKNLMNKLGHQKFYIQGGNWGAIIGANMATFFQDSCLGFHTNMGISLTNTAFAMIASSAVYPNAIVPTQLTNRLYPLVETVKFMALESGYFHMQATKPDTIGIGMTQSPASLAGWFLSLFSVGISSDVRSSDRGGLDLFTPEQLIDNIMLYWAPNKASSALRIYAETFNERNRRMGYINVPTSVPTVVVQAKNELFYQPPAVLNTKFTNLVDVDVLDKHGHFLALEAPVEFSELVLSGLQKIMEFRRNNNMDRTTKCLQIQTKNSGTEN